MITVTLRDLDTLLPLAAKSKKSILIQSSAGVGKSEKIAQFAERLLKEKIAEAETNGDTELANYLKTLKGNNVVDIRLANESPEKSCGLLIPTKRPDGTWVSQTAYNERYPTDPRWVGVIFFDEIGNAPKLQQNLAFQGLNDRKVDTLPFPEGAVVVGAMNGVEHSSVANELPAPVTNRVRLFNVRPCANIWIEDFALANAVHPSIISLLKTKPDLIDTYGKKSNLPSFASSRAWTDFSRTVYDFDDGLLTDELLMATGFGTIGDIAYNEWKINYELGAGLPPTELILQGKRPEFKERHKRELQFYVGYNCESLIVKKIMEGTVKPDELVEVIDNVFDYFANEAAFTEELLTGNAFSLNKTLTTMEVPDQYKDICKSLLSNNGSIFLRKALAKFVTLQAKAKAA